MHSLLRGLLGLAVGDLRDNRNFTLVWASATVSGLGAQVSQLAIPLIAATLLHATPSQMGLLVACETLPFALFSLPAGVWLDRVKTRPIVLYGELAAAALLLSIPLCAWLGWLGFALLYAVSFGIGSTLAVSSAAAQMLVARLVDRDQLVAANARLQVTWSAATLIGPGIGGMLVQLLTAPFAILLDGLCLFLSAGFIARTRFTEASPAGDEPAFFGELLAGLRFVWGDYTLRGVTLSVALLSLVLHGYFALQVLFATRELGMSAGDLGLALMIGGAGALLAGAISTGLAARIGIGRVLVFGYALTALGWTAIAFLPPSQTAGTLVLGLGIGVFEFGQTLFVVSYVSLRQALTPDHMLGRVIGTMRFLTVAPAPVGALVGGWLAEQVGIRPALGVLAICGWLLTAHVTLLTPVRNIRNLNAARSTV